MIQSATLFGQERLANHSFGIRKCSNKTLTWDIVGKDPIRELVLESCPSVHRKGIQTSN